jgi:hypothetical protein
MTAGCAQLPGQAPLGVSIPDDCDRNAEPVPYPRVVAKEDLGVRSAKYAAALGEANTRLEDVKACYAQVRASFAR